MTVTVGQRQTDRHGQRDRDRVEDKDSKRETGTQTDRQTDRQTKTLDLSAIARTKFKMMWLIFEFLPLTLGTPAIFGRTHTH